MSEPSKRIVPPEALAVQNPPWEAGDVQHFRDFLSKYGHRFLPYLAARVPAIEGDNMEQLAISGAKHAGYEELFKVLSGMATESVSPERSPFIGNEGEDAR